MAHLKDMEEAFSSIDSVIIQDYMKEAMNCYMASAYRGCIVLSYIALFDNLLTRLEELGRVNRIAKDIYKEAYKRKDNQDIFESFLIDKLSSNNLLPELDIKFLNILRDLRNKSAHPSGHKPSAEEARYIYSEVINRFLSKPILFTTRLIDEILGRLPNNNFFPNNTVDKLALIVEDELVSFNKEALPQLIEKLLEKLESNETAYKKNIKYFIYGMARLDQDDINYQLKERIILKKSDDQQYADLILSLFSSNAKLAIGLPKVCIDRINNIFSNKIKNIDSGYSENKITHPICVFISLSKIIKEEVLIENSKNQIIDLFKEIPYSNRLLLSLSGKDKLFESYFNIISDYAGSSEFAEANGFANSINGLDENLAKLLSDKQALIIILRIIKASNNGAYDSISLVKSKFNSICHIKNKAVNYLSNSAESAETLILNLIKFDEKLDIFIKRYISSDTEI